MGQLHALIKPLHYLILIVAHDVVSRHQDVEKARLTVTTHIPLQLVYLGQRWVLPTRAQ